MARVRVGSPGGTTPLDPSQQLLDSRQGSSAAHAATSTAAVFAQATRSSRSHRASRPIPRHKASAR